MLRRREVPEKGCRLRRCWCCVRQRWPHYDAAEAPITCVAVPPGDVAPDHAGLLAMSAVIGEVARRGELGLDPVEPAGVGRRVGQLDVVRCGPAADPGVVAGGQVRAEV